MLFFSIIRTFLLVGFSPPKPPNNYGDVYDEVDDLYAEVSSVENYFLVSVLGSSYMGR